jgi:large subunit ribosomal protein L21e|tara:strand:- start:1198 stop:1488 length:291 start_codon:yes stop_codon:yes gene_type:complete
MTQRAGGFRRKSRHKLRKNKALRGFVRIKDYLRGFKEGDKVYLKAEPAIQKGMYFPRFHNKVGKVIKKQGKCYKVEIKDGSKPKMIIVHPIHLRSV